MYVLPSSWLLFFVFPSHIPFIFPIPFQEALPWKHTISSFLLHCGLLKLVPWVVLKATNVA